MKHLLITLNYIIKIIRSMTKMRSLILKQPHLVVGVEKKVEKDRKDRKIQIRRFNSIQYLK